MALLYSHLPGGLAEWRVVFLALFFLVVAVFSAGLFWVLYRALRRRMSHAGPVLAVCWLFSLALLFPVPIHGGFLLSGELWWEALQEWREDRASREREKRERREKSQEQQAGRFAAPLATRLLEAGVPWARVATEQGQLAYLHRPSGLVFSAPVPWAVPGEVSWEAAHAACQAWPPAGSWALPTQAELYLFWRDDGSAMSPWGAGRFVSVLVDPELGLQMTVRHLGPGPERLRCVARDRLTDGTGIDRTEIALEDWNRYQLAADRYR